MPPDPEEYHCELCDCTFEVRIVDPGAQQSAYQVGVEEHVIGHCPFCGEPLDATNCEENKMGRELPEVPWRVLAYFNDGKNKYGPYWWHKHVGELWRCCDRDWQHLCVRPKLLEIVYHAESDHDSAEQILAARRAAFVVHT